MHFTLVMILLLKHRSLDTHYSEGGPGDVHRDPDNHAFQLKR
jgi:hypothetical protein